MSEPSGNSSSVFASRRDFRFGRMRLAFFTSATSKSLGFVVHFLALPLAVTALGAERFGIYTMLVSALVWIDLGRLGIGPGLTRGMAVAWNENDKETEQRLFSNAFLLLTTMAAAIGCIVLTAFAMSSGLSLDPIFGPSASKYRPEIRVGVFVVVGSLMAQIIFSAGESARSAYQEDYINNSLNIFGNLVAIFLVFGVATIWPTIQGFAIAVFGSIALSKGINLLLLVRRNNYFLSPQWRHLEIKIIKPLLNSSFAFWVVQIGTLMMHNFSLVLLGSKVGPENLAPFAVLFRLLQLLSTFVLMMTMPIWPAITDALVRKDYDWIFYAYRRLLKLTLLYSFAVALIVSFMGSDLIYVWVGNFVKIDAALTKFLSIYFVIWMWNHANTAVLFGLGKIRPVAITIFIEGTVVLLLGSVLTQYLGNIGMALSLCIAGLITSGWFLPLLIYREAQKLRIEMNSQIA